MTDLICRDKTKRCQKLTSLFLLIVLFFLIGCGSKKTRTTPIFRERQYKPVAVKQKAPEPPKKIKITLILEDWAVADHNMVNWNPSFGRLYFSGRFIMGNELVFKLISDKINKYYWLAKIPQAREGQYTINADRFEDILEIDPLPDPVDKFNIVMNIENKLIVRQFIPNLRPIWGIFRFKKVKEGKLYIINDWYPGKIWAGRLPKADGEYTVHMILLN